MISQADNMWDCKLKTVLGAFKYIVIFKYRPRSILKQCIEQHTYASVVPESGDEDSDAGFELDERRTNRAADRKRAREEVEENRRLARVSGESTLSRNAARL
jgi:hypothetical protein